jgi:hypothetical protein
MADGSPGRRETVSVAAASPWGNETHINQTAVREIEPS